MGKYFVSADILLPKNCQMDRWAVIACDQFTSDRDYWKRVRNYVGDAPSTLNMILPEAELAEANDETIQAINAYMQRYLEQDLFCTYPDSFVYIERTLVDGSVRQGVIGAVDLANYHYEPARHPMICATEMTVLERIPPRVAVRKDAPLELSHVLLLCDDPKKQIIETVATQKEQLPALYECDLMENGGHIAAWLVQGEIAEQLKKLLDTYEATNTYLVGDGNHSLVTAKTCYEQLKGTMSEEAYASHPARFALVELENVHSEALVFEPIHRIISSTDPAKLLNDLQTICADDGVEVICCLGGKDQILHIRTPKGELAVGVLQDFLDQWLANHPGEIDYVHGEEAVHLLAQAPGSIGFLLPGMDKSELFPFVQAGRTLPRKTFSMGHGCEKRYYLEGRKIK